MKLLNVMTSLCINPYDAEALCNKGNALYKLGKYNEAIDYYEQTLIVKPGSH